MRKKSRGRRPKEASSSLSRRRERKKDSEVKESAREKEERNGDQVRGDEGRARLKK